MNRTRLVHLARIACGLLVASSLLGTGSGEATAQTPPAPTLGGFTGTAAASGVHVKYNPEGLLPIGAPVDLGAPDALATIASGPSTFARASVADPGDLIANPSALIGLLNPQAPALPAYPFRIAASSGVGQPTAESNPGPGLHARVEVTPTGSSAVASTPLIDAPAVARVGTMAATATTETDGSSVTVHARSEIGSIDILGLIHIDALVTDVTATSAGGDTELSGGTTVVGGTLLGQPITIDDEGVRAFLGPLDLGNVLKQLGISITVPGPVELDGTTSGQLASTGLRIDIVASAENVPGLIDIIDALPPLESPIPGAPSIEDLLAVARAHHVLSIEIGRGVVSLTGRASAPRPTTPPTSGSSGSSGGGPVVTSPRTTPTVARPTGNVAAPVVSPEAGPEVTPAVPVSSTGDGAGVGALALVLLLAAPFFGDRFSRIAAAQLATDQEGCPWEQR